MWRPPLSTEAMLQTAPGPVSQSEINIIGLSFSYLALWDQYPWSKPLDLMGTLHLVGHMVSLFWYVCMHLNVCFNNLCTHFSPSPLPWLVSSTRRRWGCLLCWALRDQSPWRYCHALPEIHRQVYHTQAHIKSSNVWSTAHFESNIAKHNKDNLYPGISDPRHELHAIVLVINVHVW